MNIKPVIAASNSSQSPGVTLTLESTGVLLGILVSGSILLGLGIKAVSNINRISLSIIQIDKDLKELADNAEKIRQIDKRVDLHIQEYVNGKDVTQMLLGQMNEKINHKFKRLLFYSREIQRFLQKDTAFRIREYEENSEQE